VAQGKSKRDAAIAAGYSQKDASTRGYRLSKKAEISLRMEELQAQAADKAIENATKLDESEKIGLITAPIDQQRERDVVAAEFAVHVALLREWRATG
jgi:phage terminase small subunit